MANMSYCRFHNTRLDMDDCIDALISGEPLSREEARHCQYMFNSIIGFLDSMGLVEIDQDAWEEWFEELEENVE